MTEDQAMDREDEVIDRLIAASREAFPHIDERTTVEAITAAWNEIKAIAREDIAENGRPIIGWRMKAQHSDPPEWFREAYAAGTSGDQQA